MNGGVIGLFVFAFSIFVILMVLAQLFTTFNSVGSRRDITKSLKALSVKFSGHCELNNKNHAFPLVKFSQQDVDFQVEARSATRPQAHYVVRVSAPWKQEGFRLKIVRETYKTATNDMLKALDAKVGNAKFDKMFYLRTNNAEKMRELLTAPELLLVEKLFKIGCAQIYINNNVIYAERSIQSGFVSPAFVQSFIQLALGLMNPIGNDLQFITSSTSKTIPICQVCGDGMQTDLVSCLSCKTLHHRDCWKFVGVCSTYACGATQCQGVR